MKFHVETACKPKVTTRCFSLQQLIMVLLLKIMLLIFWQNTLMAAGHSEVADRPLPQIIATDAPNMNIVHGVVQRGDTASSILNKYLGLSSIYDIDQKSSDIFSFSRIRKGQPYFMILENDRLVRFEYEIDTEDKLVVQKEGESFTISRRPIQYDVQLELVSTTITSSLFGAVRKCGEKNELAMKLSDIFAWDIDFIRDIQSGDHFKVLVEKRYRKGKLSGYGAVHAAFFRNKQTVYKAFLYQDNSGAYGYYDESGRSVQKAFLKAPLKFSRISSKFSKKRFHPILKVNRPHHGTDYAAPKGTPIKTVGDGTIAQIGYNRGKGNFITIRHYNGYTTSYYHMCRFAGGMKKNKRVLQGDTIGFVGMTGYATGPHLCFRMKKNGQHVDPLNHKSPSAKPVNFEEMGRFLAKRTQLSRRLFIEYQLAMLHN